MKENNTPKINAVEGGNKIEPIKQSKINEISQEGLEDRLHKFLVIVYEVGF